MQPLELPFLATNKKKTPTLQWSCVRIERNQAIDEFLELYAVKNNEKDLLAAAFLVFSARLSGQYQCHVWYTHSELLKELEGLTGLYATHVPLPAKISPDSCCSDVLAVIMEEMAGSRNQGTYIRDMFTRFPDLRQKAQSLGVGVETVEKGLWSTPTSSMSLRFIVDECDKGPILAFDQTVVDELTVETIVERFLIFLRGATSAPEVRLKELPLLTKKERHQILVEWNATEDLTVPNRCVHQLFEEQATSRPNRIAAVYEAQYLTYMELNQKANGLAGLLIDQDVGKGCYVPVLMQSGLNLLIAYLAIMKSGAIFAPIDPNWPSERIGKILADLNAHVVVVESIHNHKVMLEAAENSPSIIRVNHRELVLQQQNLDISINLGDPLYVIYTSGSTGQPKGVINCHRGAVNRFFGASKELIQLGLAVDEMRVLNTISPIFDPSILQLLWPLTSGGRTIISSPKLRSDLDYLLETVSREKVTSTSLVASLFNVLTNLLMTSMACREKLASLNCLLVGGEQVDIAVVKKFRALCPQVQVSIIYGPTETAMGVISHHVRDDAHKTLPIGRPLPNVQAYVLNDDLEPVPVGVIGELCIGGVQVGFGYLNDSYATDRAFIYNPFSTSGEDRLYRTGDLACYQSDGNIVFVGRKDDQIKIRGMRIELGEIKAALDAHPDVKESAVTAIKGYDGNVNLIGYIVARSQANPSTGVLRKFLGSKLPETYIPSNFFVLEAIPRLASGKIDKHRLPRLQPTVFDEKSSTLFESTMEKTIISICSEILGIDSIDNKRNLFELGMDSLSIMRLISRLRENPSIELSVRDVFNNPIIEDLAAAIEETIQE